MTTGKVHLEVVTQEPNESDTSGESYIACGLDSVGDGSRLTERAENVTCLRCLKVLEKGIKSDWRPMIAA